MPLSIEKPRAVLSPLLSIYFRGSLLRESLTRSLFLLPSPSLSLSYFLFPRDADARFRWKMSAFCGRAVVRRIASRKLACAPDGRKRKKIRSSTEIHLVGWIRAERGRKEVCGSYRCAVEIERNSTFPLKWAAWSFFVDLLARYLASISGQVLVCPLELDQRRTSGCIDGYR